VVSLELSMITRVVSLELSMVAVFHPTLSNLKQTKSLLSQQHWIINYFRVIVVLAMSQHSYYLTVLITYIASTLVKI